MEEASKHLLSLIYWVTRTWICDFHYGLDIGCLAGDLELKGRLRSRLLFALQQDLQTSGESQESDHIVYSGMHRVEWQCMECVG